MKSFLQYLVETTHAIDKLKDRYGQTTSANSVKNIPTNQLHKTGFALIQAASRDNSFPKHEIHQRVSQSNRDFGSTSLHQVNHIALANDQVPITHHIIDHLATADPSKDKKHLPHIVGWYAKNQFRHEDIGSTDNPNTVNGVLSRFSDLKNKAAFPNFTHPETNQTVKGTKLESYRHMSFPEFRNHVHKQLGIEQGGGLEGVSNIPGMKLIHQEPDLTVHHITTKEAAIRLGQETGAKWCTGWKENNQFEHHNSKGPLYHIMGKDRHGEKYHAQFHFPTNQFAEHDDTMLPIHEFIDSHPQLKNVKAFKDASVDHPDLPFHSKEEATKIGNEHVDNLINGKIHKKGLIHQTMMATSHADEDHIKDLHDWNFAKRERVHIPQSDIERMDSMPISHPKSIIHSMTQEALHSRFGVEPATDPNGKYKPKDMHNWHAAAADFHYAEATHLEDIGDIAASIHHDSRSNFHETQSNKHAEKI